MARSGNCRIGAHNRGVQVGDGIDQLAVTMPSALRPPHQEKPAPEGT